MSVIQGLLPITHFETSEGVPVANGYVLIRLSQDAQVPSLPAQICAGISSRIDLDENGDTEGQSVVWANSALLPSGTFYLVDVFTAQGFCVARDLQYVAAASSEGFGLSFGTNFSS